ncbi:extracellular solute-binding protein [Paenibacillus sp. CN-4]|uniref:extracellular solute-binding protein n=1 Tax=Paenibacillus nanchangensis TaxID=3348343 RepID=UPI003978BAD4
MGKRAGAADEEKTGQPEQAISDEAGRPEQAGALRILIDGSRGFRADELGRYEREIGRLTGIRAKLSLTDSSAAANTRYEAFKNTDLVYLSRDRMSELAAAGALLPLNGWVDVSPVLSDPTIIEPADWEWVTQPDGIIYGVAAEKPGGMLPIVREDWLESLGLAEPDTLEEYAEVLRAFKKGDPDGNGRQDTWGLSFAGAEDLQAFMSAAGLPRGLRLDLETGKRDMPYASEQAVPVYEWLAALYRDGILEPGFAENDTKHLKELFVSGQVGMIIGPDEWIGELMGYGVNASGTVLQVSGLPAPSGPNGEKLLRRDAPGVWAVPAGVRNTEAAIRFVEFWHSEPGNVLSTIGIAGLDWTHDRAGNAVLTEVGTAHGMDHGAPFPNNTNFVHRVEPEPALMKARRLLDETGVPEPETPDWKAAEEIIRPYILSAIQGELSGAQAVAMMRGELRSAGLID